MTKAEITTIDAWIEKEFDDLSCTVQEDERSDILDNIIKLHKLKMEASKIENDAKEARIDRWLKYGLEAAGIGLPLIFYAVWMKKGFEFEKYGTFTSTVFRGLFSRFRPTAK